MNFYLFFMTWLNADLNTYNDPYYTYSFLKLRPFIFPYCRKRSILK
jgi:hypothetical protein